MVSFSCGFPVTLEHFRPVCILALALRIILGMCFSPLPVTLVLFLPVPFVISVVADFTLGFLARLSIPHLFDQCHCVRVVKVNAHGFHIITLAHQDCAF